MAADLELQMLDRQIGGADRHIRAGNDDDDVDAMRGQPAADRARIPVRIADPHP